MRAWLNDVNLCYRIQINNKPIKHDWIHDLTGLSRTGLPKTYSFRLLSLDSKWREISIAIEIVFLLSTLKKT
ncbi:MAG: hypothetical protein ACKO6H_05405, partial [Betaproteobacteria bacterium]